MHKSSQKARIRLLSSNHSDASYLVKLQDRFNVKVFKQNTKDSRKFSLKCNLYRVSKLRHKIIYNRSHNLCSIMLHKVWINKATWFHTWKVATSLSREARLAPQIVQVEDQIHDRSKPIGNNRIEIKCRKECQIQSKLTRSESFKVLQIVTIQIN